MLVWTELIEFMGEMQRRLEEKETDPDKMGKSWRSMPISLYNAMAQSTCRLRYSPTKASR